MKHLYLKKIWDKLTNSLIFLMSICILTGFMFCAVVLVQVPEYIESARQKRLDAERTELTQTLDDLEKNYHDNSLEFYVAYLDSSLYEWGEYGDLPIEDYTDEIIHICTMNRYFSKYLQDILTDVSQEEFSTEVSAFIDVYEDTLLEYPEFEDIISDREILKSAIREVLGKLKAVPQ